MTRAIDDGFDDDTLVSLPPLRIPTFYDSSPPGEAGTRETPRGRPSSWPGAWSVEDGSGEHSFPPTMVDAPPLDRVPLVLLALAREVGIEGADASIVHAFVEAMRSLFPGRRFAVHLLATPTGDPSLFHATHPLISPPRVPGLIESRAIELHGLTPEAVADAGLVTTARYAPMFEAHAEGFDVPLTDGGRPLGVLSVELPPGRPIPPWDAPILVPLALEMASRLRSARLLRQSNYLRDYLAQVLERANAPIVVLRPDLSVENVNLAFLTMTQAPRAHWVGADLVAQVAPSDRSRAIEALEAARRGEPRTDVELRLPRPMGATAKVSFNTASIVATDGALAGIVAIGRDLTEVRDLEEQIIQAEKLATLGQLAAGVVHELNNPLTSISVYAEYLLQKGRRAGQDPADLERMSRIVEASARMLRFTRDLVSYARPASEAPMQVSLADVVDQSLVFCEHVIGEAGVRIERRYADGTAPLRAVRGQLHQVFINLITNACHAIGDGGTDPALTVTVGPCERGSALLVQLEDRGPGIEARHLERIFDPFFSTKSEGKGTGLGLSIVRNIVQQHGGTIEVRSVHGQPGSGTTFVLRFPLRDTLVP